MLEADGNGVANEESDYQAARCFTIGIGMKFADEPPQVGPVSVKETDEGITIAAEKITSTKEIQRVWPLIQRIPFLTKELQWILSALRMVSIM
jgi:hypothetical protein